MLSPMEIRGKLREWVSANLSSGPDDVLIDELGFVNLRPGRTIDNTFRADLALANGRLVGFEIKSGSDSLKRWPSQCEAYFNVFDEVWLCTHGRHLEKALTMTPKNTGVLLVDDLGGFAILRSAKANESVSAYDITGLLWRDELDEMCLAAGIKCLSRHTKKDVRLKVSQSISIADIRAFALQKLKARKSDLIP